MDIFTPFDSTMVDGLWLFFMIPFVAGVAAFAGWLVVDKVRLRKQDQAEAALAAEAGAK